MSIPLQRAPLLMIAMLLFAYTILFRASPESNYRYTKVHTPNLSNTARQLDYKTLEYAFASLRFDEQGVAIPNAKFASQLSAFLDSNDILQPPVIERVEFLLEKQTSPKAYKNVVALLRHFLIYKQRLEAINKHTPNSIEEHNNHNHRIESLQNDIFGHDLAEKLFAVQRRMREIMFFENQLIKDNIRTKIPH
ncbi:MAG: hypothetical protein ABW098_05375 [Candidatus Thiodiazotropha sp.]